MPAGFVRRRRIKSGYRRSVPFWCRGTSPSVRRNLGSLGLGWSWFARPSRSRGLAVTIQIIDDTLISLPLASPMAGRLFAAVVVFAVTPEKRTSRASGARELVKWTPDDMHIAETPMLRQRGGELQISI